MIKSIYKALGVKKGVAKPGDLMRARDKKVMKSVKKLASKKK